MKKALAIILSGLFVLGLTACEKEPGPAEKAGKQLDEAAATAKKKVDDAVSAAEEKLSDGEKQAE